jgi:hypothetical protein
MEVLVSRLREHLAPHGLNLVGTTTVESYDAVAPSRWALGPQAPEARTVVVIGNGGTAFWEAFRSRREAGDPAASRGPNPLDDFTRSVVREAVDAAGVDPKARLVFPFELRPVLLSFVHLAERAGLGRTSLLGVLVHPEFGPWMALRAALLLPFVLDAPRPADGFDPCPTCIERPCIAACPGGAIGPAGWDVPGCAAHRLSGHGDGCDAGCHARIACVIGPAHRYPPDALAFHQAYAGAAMRAAREGARGSAQPSPVDRFDNASRNVRARRGAPPASSCFKKT